VGNSSVGFVIVIVVVAVVVVLLGALAGVACFYRNLRHRDRKVDTQHPMWRENPHPVKHESGSDGEPCSSGDAGVPKVESITSKTTGPATPTTVDHEQYSWPEKQLEENAESPEGPPARFVNPSRQEQPRARAALTELLTKVDKSDRLLPPGRGHHRPGFQ